MSESNQNFLNQLAYFGGNISGDPGSVRDQYLDLEDFVILATHHMADDPRVTHCFLTWLEFYGTLLSPSKLRKLLDSKPFDPVVLGAFLSVIKSVSLRKKQWTIINPYVKRIKTQVLFQSLPPPRQETNPHFKSVGLLAHPFKFEPEKFLVSLPFILEQCLEIKYRAMGVGPVSADLRSYLEKQTPQTLYEVAKATHHFRSQINLNYKNLSHFGIFDGSLLR